MAVLEKFGSLKNKVVKQMVISKSDERRSSWPRLKETFLKDFHYGFLLYYTLLTTVVMNTRPYKANWCYVALSVGVSGICLEVGQK